MHISSGGLLINNHQLVGFTVMGTPICRIWCISGLLINNHRLIGFYRNGQSYLQDLKTDPKDEYLALLRATVKCLIRPEMYFEKVLRLAINKRGTDEGALTRVVTTRAEVDMKVIKDEYQRRNSIPLDRAIVKDTTGDYEKMLLALIGHEDAWAVPCFKDDFLLKRLYIYELVLMVLSCCVFYASYVWSSIVNLMG